MKRVLLSVVVLGLLIGLPIGAYMYGVSQSPAVMDQEPDRSPVVAPVETGRMDDALELFSVKAARGGVTFGIRNYSTASPQVVTAIPDAADGFAPGDKLVEISQRPVFLFAGNVPAYRDLEEGMVGDDVAAVKAALIRKGLLPVQPSLEHWDAPMTAALNALYQQAGYGVAGVPGKPSLPLSEYAIVPAISASIPDEAMVSTPSTDGVDAEGSDTDSDPSTADATTDTTVEASESASDDAATPSPTVTPAPTGTDAGEASTVDDPALSTEAAPVIDVSVEEHDTHGLERDIRWSIVPESTEGTGTPTPGVGASGVPPLRVGGEPGPLLATLTSGLPVVTGNIDVTAAAAIKQGMHVTLTSDAGPSQGVVLSVTPSSTEGIVTVTVQTPTLLTNTLPVTASVIIEERSEELLMAPASAITTTPGGESQIGVLGDGDVVRFVPVTVVRTHQGMVGFTVEGDAIKSGDSVVVYEYQ